mgnify:FL=1
MIVYQTDDYGVFVGTTIADQDPKDASNKLIPAGATDIEPPTTTSEELARWDGYSWIVESLPAPKLEDPVAPQDPDQSGRDERNFLLNKHVDPRMSNPNWWASLDSIMQGEIEQYRLDLLDVPQQSEFPYNITWPQEPSA